MKPIKTNRSNFTYRGPTPDIMDLPCERARVNGAEGTPGLDGGGVVFSVWEPSEDEREFVARGGNIKLGIYGMEPIPPVSLQIVNEGMAEHRGICTTAELEQHGDSVLITWRDWVWLREKLAEWYENGMEMPDLIPEERVGYKHALNLVLREMDETQP